jgi:pre-mRNA-splicing factor ATP-dependent RNA helicase DHX16
MNPFAEQEAWEDHQIGKATLKFGAKNKQASDDYQFVFEDQINFIKESVMAGENYEDAMDAKQKSQDLAEKTALEELQEVRRSLPIYTYRDQLLKAVEEHQVIQAFMPFLISSNNKREAYFTNPYRKQYFPVITFEYV